MVVPKRHSDRTQAPRASSEKVVDPRVVSVVTRRSADQLLGSRWATVKRADVEGTWRFKVSPKEDELIDRIMVYQRLRVMKVDSGTGDSVEIPRATIHVEASAPPAPPARATAAAGADSDVESATTSWAWEDVVATHRPRVKSVEGDIVSGCALLGACMFKNVHVSANKTRISQDTRGHLPWTVYVRAILEHERGDVEHGLKSAFFQPDTPGSQTRPDEPTVYTANPYTPDKGRRANSALLARHLACAGSAPFDLYWPIELLDSFNFKDRTRALPAGLELELNFLEGDSALVITSTVRAKYRVELAEMWLDVCLLKLAPVSMPSYDLSLRRAPFEAYLEHWTTEQSYVPAGDVRSSKTFSGELPPMFHVVFMAQRQFHGDFAFNPHYFYHYNVSQLVVDYSDGNEPLTITYDWTQTAAGRTRMPNRAFFMHCHFEPGIPLASAGGFLTPESFGQGYSIFTVNTSGAHTYNREIESVPKFGPCEFRWIFGKKIPLGGIVILYMMPRPKTLLIGHDNATTVV